MGDNKITIITVQKLDYSQLRNKMARDFGMTFDEATSINRFLSAIEKSGKRVVNFFMDYMSLNRYSNRYSADNKSEDEMLDILNTEFESCRNKILEETELDIFDFVWEEGEYLNIVEFLANKDTQEKVARLIKITLGVDIFKGDEEHE